ncbi:hypothetical protein V6N13_015958 [Hibiscus sabdariffa]
MVNSPRFQYSGKVISFFDMCHIDSMSMLEMYDIIEELGYSEEDVGESNETVGTVDHVMEDSNPPVRTDSNPHVRTEEPIRIEEHVRTEDPEPISSDEDSDYVVDSGFEDSEDVGSDEEGFAHEVHVQMGSEMDMNNLNSDLLSGCLAVTLDDEEVNDGAKSLHSAIESDSNAEQNRKPKCLEFNIGSDSLNP